MNKEAGPTVCTGSSAGLLEGKREGAGDLEISGPFAPVAGGRTLRNPPKVLSASADNTGMENTINGYDNQTPPLPLEVSLFLRESNSSVKKG